MTIGNHNAFATPFPRGTIYKDDGNYHGLSKREYFAAMALQGIIAAHNMYETGIDGIGNEVNAKAAVNAADALIKALNEEK